MVLLRSGTGQWHLWYCIVNWEWNAALRALVVNRHGLIIYPPEKSKYAFPEVDVPRYLGFVL